MPELIAESVSLGYPEKNGYHEVLQGLDLHIASGDAVVVLGPSGCGKTSLLNVLAGFEIPDSGRVRLDGKDAGPPDGRRGVVFQDDALLPWLSVLGNVTLGPRLRGMPRSECQALAERMLHKVGLDGYAERRIDQLSGGQRQRLGLARALAVDPAFLLLDEPFGALDALTRERMQSLLLNIWRDTGKGLFMITHSVDEALLVATHLVLMDGPPLTVRRRLSPPFSQRYARGESLRALKACPTFETLRRELLHDFLDPREARP